MWFRFIAYFIIFLQDNFIHCMINNIIFLFLSVKFIHFRSIMPAVLSRTDFIMLKTKVPQDFAFIWLITEAVYETSLFRYIIWMIYIPFSVLSSSLICLGVCIWRGRFSSHFPAVTGTVGICPSIFLIRRFYYTFINILWYLHASKHVNKFLKSKV